MKRRDRASERAAADFDALLAILPEDAPDALLAALPHADRWRRLHAEARTASRAVRSAPLPNARLTHAVIGVLPERASTFERLSLAGRMLKEASVREPGRIGLAVPSEDGGRGEALAALLSASLTRAFELPAFRSAAASARRLRRIDVLGTAKLDVPFIEAAASGNNLARHLTALPPNVLDASAYRRALAALAREHRLTLRWIDERALARLGAGAFLAVSGGNAERTAGIAHLAYRPRRGASGRRPDVALVGKGILFDTGGTNSKPHRAMLEMHTDMAGSAVALATLVALARLRAPLAADAWLAITENAIGPRAYRPQDVVRAANGTTIQVIHTDAEGRMVLADTLALAGRTAPRLMIDFGTLTGTCVQALTERMSGLFTNEPRLSGKLLEAGRSSGERVWSFPYDADYDQDLESKVADVLQCTVESKGDHILAARFLGRFVPAGTAWVHLDLASAVRSGGLADIDTDVTGFGVRYALELLLKARVLDEMGSP